MIQAAINGKRSKHEHAHVPVTALELLHEAEASLKAGAETIHLHVRNNEGKESFDHEAVAVQVGQLREALPGIAIGISTGAWVVPEIEKWVALINALEALPDYVSVNGHEPGFPQIIEAVLKKGIGIEAGIRDEEAARRFLADDILKHCLRILIEPAEQEFDAALRTVEAIEKTLSNEVPAYKILLHGLDGTCWPVLKTAVSRGYHLRIGLEDTLVNEDGEPATDNAALVTYANRLIHRAFSAIPDRYTNVGG
jgi:uncharacterized protein (DUF849 family)